MLNILVNQTMIAFRNIPYSLYSFKPNYTKNFYLYNQFMKRTDIEIVLEALINILSQILYKMLVQKSISQIGDLEFEHGC